MANEGSGLNPLDLCHKVPEILKLMESLDLDLSCSLTISILQRCMSAVKRCSQEDVNNLLQDPNMLRFSASVQRVLQAATIPPFDSRDYFSYCEDDFKGFPECTELVLSLISELLKLWKLYSSVPLCLDAGLNPFESTIEMNSLHEGRPKVNEVGLPDIPWLYSNQMELLIIIGAHMKSKLWSSAKTQIMCSVLLEQLLGNHINSVSELLCTKTTHYSTSKSKSVQEKSSLLVQILDHCKLALGKEQWERNPFLAEAFSWTVSNVKSPNLSDHINQVMATSLNFIDDHQTINKVRGIEILHHLLQNTSAEEMRWYNRAEVIFESLKHQLYSKEIEVLQKLWPCLLNLLLVLEPGRNHEFVRHHEVYETLLRETESENLLAIRRIYMVQLKNFTTQIGIGCVRHLKTLVRIIEQYLEVEDGPQDQARCGALALLHTVVTIAWPRVNQHVQKIVHSLCKFLLDINSSSAANVQISPDAKQYMNDQAVDTLRLLKQICPNLQPCLQALGDSKSLVVLEPILCRVLL